jgi:hypothetical protein
MLYDARALVFLFSPLDFSSSNLSLLAMLLKFFSFCLSLSNYCSKSAMLLRVAVGKVEARAGEFRISISPIILLKDV